MRRQLSCPLEVSTWRSSAFCFPISPRIGNRHASCIIEDPWRFRGTIYFERLRGTRKEKLATGPVTARHESRLVAIVRKSGRKIEWMSSEAEVVEHWHFVSRFVATDASQNMVMVVLYEIGRENISRGLFGPPTELPTPRWSVFVPPHFSAIPHVPSRTFADGQTS